MECLYVCLTWGGLFVWFSGVCFSTGIAELVVALQLAPNDVQLKGRRVFCLYMQGKMKKACNETEQLVEQMMSEPESSSSDSLSDSGEKKNGKGITADMAVGFLMQLKEDGVKQKEISSLPEEMQTFYEAALWDELMDQSMTEMQRFHPALLGMRARLFNHEQETKEDLVHGTIDLDFNERQRMLDSLNEDRVASVYRQEFKKEHGETSDTSDWENEPDAIYNGTLPSKVVSIRYSGYEEYGGINDPCVQSIICPERVKMEQLDQMPIYLDDRAHSDFFKELYEYTNRFRIRGRKDQIWNHANVINDLPQLTPASNYYTQAGLWEQAMFVQNRTLHDIWEVSKQLAETEKELGNLAFSSKRYQSALRQYTTAISYNWSDHIFYSNRATVSMKLNHWYDMISDCSKSIQLEPSIKAHMRRAKAWMELQEYHAAALDFEAGLQFEKRNKECQKGLASARKMMKEQLEQRFGMLSDLLTN
eukprot:TRINITY_DN84_c0_g1_i6.p1 TRINITY_DN84_c0_g1~~TRINITY_DN84_c0_g1_i6.p1  ORF type:complete len:477 (+),score=152.83 TRINITY_DN84_c0_g1_i6:102-1532(+)